MHKVQTTEDTCPSPGMGSFARGGHQCCLTDITVHLEDFLMLDSEITTFVETLMANKARGATPWILIPVGDIVMLVHIKLLVLICMVCFPVICVHGGVKPEKIL